MATGKAPRAVRKAIKANLAAKSADISADVKKTRAAGATSVNKSQGKKLDILNKERVSSSKMGVSGKASFKAIEKGRKAGEKPGGRDKMVVKAYNANVKASKAAAKKAK